MIVVMQVSTKLESGWNVIAGAVYFSLLTFWCIYISYSQGQPV
jgi:hypothetical protein